MTGLSSGAIILDEGRVEALAPVPSAYRLSGEFAFPADLMYNRYWAIGGLFGLMKKLHADFLLHQGERKPDPGLEQPRIFLFQFFHSISIGMNFYTKFYINAKSAENLYIIRVSSCEC